MGIFYKVTVGLNVIIALFSFGIFVASCVFIANYREADTLFSRGDFAWLLVGGFLGMIVSCMGCWGAKDPVGKYNFLFCYFVILTLVLIMFGLGFYFYRVFVLDIEAAADGDVESAFRIESAKEFNDLLLSIYTTCCTGCPQLDSNDVATNCVGDDDLEVEFDPAPCPTVGFNDDTQDCALVSVCDDVQRDVNEGLDQGCIINSQAVPSYDLGDNFCIFFSEFATDDNGNDIVGELPDSCGGGDPVVFVNRVGEFVGKNYLVIASFWGLGIVFLFIAWCGALLMLLCPHRFDRESK